jgi:hypothetical protein
MQQNQILMLVGVFVLGMLVYHMLKGMCGCKLVEGLPNFPDMTEEEERQFVQQSTQEFTAQLRRRPNYRGIKLTQAELDRRQQESAWAQRQSRLNQGAIDRGEVVVGGN